jgi:hypothetical protein
MVAASQITPKPRLSQRSTIYQVFLARPEKFFDAGLRGKRRIPAIRKGAHHAAVIDEPPALLPVNLSSIELRQHRSVLQTQSRCVKQIAINHLELDSFKGFFD